MTIKALNYFVPDSQIADLRARLSDVIVCETNSGT